MIFYPKKLVKKDGFVLLEVMIALVIFAVSILALIDGVGNSERASGEAEKVQKAAMLARLKIAEIKLSLDEEVARGVFPDEKAESGTFKEPYEDYKWSYTIRKVEIPVVQPSSDQSQVSLGQPSSTGATPNQAGADVLGAANSMAQMVAKKISESIREMKITVSWGDNESEMQKIVITTHLAKLR